MKKVTVTEVNGSHDREAWLALRLQHLTATDWPKITGTSPWGTAEDVLNEKLEADPGGAFTMTLPMQVGTDLEPLIIARTKKRRGPGEYLSQAFLSRRHMGFTPDLLRIEEASDWELSEIKVSVKDWSGRVPPEYVDQVRFQATVLGIDHVQVVHLKLANWAEGLAMIRSGAIPPRRLAVYRVEVAEAERRRIERQSRRWWMEHILGAE
jgi:predicted phage-related endonuclease